MWDSCTLRGSIKRLAVSSNHSGVTPPGPNHGVSALAHNRSDPCSFRRGPLPGAPSPPKFPSGADRVIAPSDCRMPSADPLAGTAVCRDRRRAPSSHYRNKAGEGSSSLAFATARHEVLSGFPYASSRTLHRADPAPLKLVSGPSCPSRRLFRRHHLCLQRDLAGLVERLSWGFQKSPLRRMQPKSPLPPQRSRPRTVCPKTVAARRQPPKLRNQRSHRRSSFRLRGFAPP